MKAEAIYRGNSVVWHGDCLDVAHEYQPDTFQLMITSTPYPKMAGFDLTVKEYIAWWTVRLEAWTPAINQQSGVIVQVINFPRLDSGFYDTRLLKWVPGIYEGLGYNCIHAHPWVKGNAPPSGNHDRYDRSGFEMIYVYTRAQSADDYVYNKQLADYAPKTVAKAASGNLRQTDVRGSMGEGHQRLNPAGAGPDDVIRISPTGGVEQWRPRVEGGSFPIKLADRFILTYSNKGDTIVDPFCGAGTVIVRGAEHVRLGVGVDISKEAVKTTLDWIANPSWGGKVPQVDQGLQGTLFDG